MPTITTSTQGALALRDLLRQKAEDEALDVFVVREEDAENQEGLNRIVLTVEADAPALDWGHTARRCDCEARVEVSEFGGSLPGPDGSPSLDTLLVQMLQNASNDYETFDAAGLWGIEFSGPREGRATAQPGAVNVCRFSFYYDPRP